MPDHNKPVKKHKEKIRQLLDIFITFLAISPVTFGGGFAMIPVLERAAVVKKKWIDEKEIVDIFAVAQSIPGAVAVNSSIYLGYRLAGIPGALAAMLGIVLPTFFIILILTVTLASFRDNPYVQAALKGIKPVIAALIAYAGYRMSKPALCDAAGWILAAMAIVLLLVFKDLNIFFLIVASIVAGMAIAKAKDIIASRKIRKNNGNEVNGEEGKEI